MHAVRTLADRRADVQLAVRSQRRVSGRVAELPLDQAARIRDRLQVLKRAVALEAHLLRQRAQRTRPSELASQTRWCAAAMRTCVASPSSLKHPSRSVPISARPSAALAVGDVLCRLHAYDHRASVVSACTPWPGAPLCAARGVE